jgi:hypothetical protein
MQEGEDDEGINTSTTIIPSVESRLLPNDLIVFRNQVEDHGGQTEHQEGAREPRRCAPEGGEPIQFGIAKFESNSESKITSYSN